MPGKLWSRHSAVVGHVEGSYFLTMQKPNTIPLSSWWSSKQSLYQLGNLLFKQFFLGGGWKWRTNPTSLISRGVIFLSSNQHGPRKNPLTFHCTGCFLAFLKMVYDRLGKIIPYTLNNHHCGHCSHTSRIKSWNRTTLPPSTGPTDRTLSFRAWNTYRSGQGYCGMKTRSKKAGGGGKMGVCRNPYDPWDER